jgi:hypothetical protein
MQKNIFNCKNLNKSATYKIAIAIFLLINLYAVKSSAVTHDLISAGSYNSSPGINDGLELQGSGNSVNINHEITHTANDVITTRNTHPGDLGTTTINVNFINLSTHAITAISGKAAIKSTAPNSGTISIVNNGGISAFISTETAIDFSTSNANLNLTNSAAIIVAAISGNILGSNLSDTITNSSVIAGNITLNNGNNNLINNSGGEITGNISTGTGINTITINAGTIRGDLTTTGTNNITMSGGTFDITNSQQNTGSLIVNAGTFKVAGGLTNNADKTITINDGTFNLQNSALTNHGTFIVNGGTLTNISGITNNANSTVDIKTSQSINGNYISNNATAKYVANIVNGVMTTLNLTGGAADFTIGKLEINSNNTLLRHKSRQNIITGTSPATFGLAPADITEAVDLRLMDFTVAANGNNIEITTIRLPNDLVTDPTAKIIAGHLYNGMDNEQLSNSLLDLIDLIDIKTTSEQVNKGYLELVPDTNNKEGIRSAGFIANDMSFAAIEERIEQIARLNLNSTKPGKLGYAAGGMQADKSVWIKALTNTAKQKQRERHAGYNFHSRGVAVGSDKEINESNLLGIGLTYLSSKLKTKTYPANQTDIDNYQAALYGSHYLDNYYLDGLLSCSFSKHHQKRNISFANRVAESQFYSIQPTAKIAVGYIHDLEHLEESSVIPNVSLQYSWLNQSKYNESGANGGNLHNVTSSSVTKLEAGLGVKFTTFIESRYGRIFNPTLHVMLLHDIRDTNQDFTSEFGGGWGKFMIQGVKPADTTLNAGLNINYMIGDRVNLNLKYDMYKKHTFIGHYGSLAFKYTV